MMECWKKIQKYPWYEVSSFGRVRSLRRVVIRSDGKKQTFKGRVISSPADGFGYPTVGVSNAHGRRTFRVHELVLLAFVGPRPLGCEACHRNGNPTDNRLENLRWGSHKSNGEDMVSHGTSPAGSRHGNAKLCEKTAMEIYRLSLCGLSHERIAANYPISRRTVGLISEKKRWKHIHAEASCENI